MTGNVLQPYRVALTAMERNTAGLIRADNAHHCGGDRAAWARGPAVISQLADALGGWDTSQQAWSRLVLVPREIMKPLFHLSSGGQA